MTENETIPSYLRNLDKILQKYNHQRGQDGEDFDLYYYFSHNLDTLTREQLMTICFYNVSDSRLSMIEEILDNKIYRLFDDLDVIIKSSSDQTEKDVALFVISESNLLDDSNFANMYQSDPSSSWHDDVLLAYCRSHTKDQINDFKRSIGYVSLPFVTIEPTMCETPEGTKIGLMSNEEKRFYRESKKNKI